MQYQFNAPHLKPDGSSYICSRCNKKVQTIHRIPHDKKCTAHDDGIVKITVNDYANGLELPVFVVQDSFDKSFQPFCRKLEELGDLFSMLRVMDMDGANRLVEEFSQSTCYDNSSNDRILSICKTQLSYAKDYGAKLLAAKGARNFNKAQFFIYNIQKAFKKIQEDQTYCFPNIDQTSMNLIESSSPSILQQPIQNDSDYELEYLKREIMELRKVSELVKRENMELRTELANKDLMAKYEKLQKENEKLQKEHEELQAQFANLKKSVKTSVTQSEFIAFWSK